MHRAVNPRGVWLKATAVRLGAVAATFVRESWLSVAGAGAVSYGIGMAYLPAGVIAAGVFLLWIDKQTAR